jgi:hypothetical protein
MVHKFSLKEIERRAFQFTFQDGLWDIFVGIIYLNFAITANINDWIMSDFWSSIVMLPVNLLGIAGVYAAKKHIITPRIGLVQFSQRRKKRLRNLTTVLVITLIFGVVLGGYGFYMETVWVIFPIMFAMLNITIFSIAAYSLDVSRFYLYGVWFGLSLPIGDLLKRYTDLGIRHSSFPFYFTASATIIVGLLLFLRFLRSYPIPEEQGNER